MTHPKERLLRRYDELAALVRGRCPEYAIPDCPESDLNAMASVNRMLLAQLTGQPPVIVTTKTQSFLIPQRDDE